MKSEERHELKSNELLDWLEHFPQWAQENRNNIIISGVVVILAIGGYFYYWYYWKQAVINEQLKFTTLISQVQQNTIDILRQSQQNTDTSYILINTANELGNFAENTKNDNMAALAWIKKGEALRMELHYRQIALSPEDKQIQIEKAKSSYLNALAKAAGDNQLQAKAKLGLGLCDEELGNTDAAKVIYNELASKKEYAQTAAGKQASMRLEIMDTFQKEVTFKSAPLKPQQSASENVLNLNLAPTVNAENSIEANSPAAK